METGPKARRAQVHPLPVWAGNLKKIQNYWQPEQTAKEMLYTAGCVHKRPALLRINNMATDINKFAVTGRMTAEARLEYTQGGMAICTGSIAVNRSSTNKQTGERKDDASFFDIKILGKFAESISRFLVKGQEVAAAGYLKQDRWQAQDGSNRSRVVLMVEELKLLGGRNNGGQDNGYNSGDDYGNGYGDVNGAFNNGYGA